MTSENKESPGRSDITPGWKLVPIVLLTGLILYVLIGHLGEAGEFSTVLAEARWELAFVVVGMAGVMVGLSGWRFQVVLNAAGHEISIRRALAVVLTVWPVVLLVPARANDLLRAAVLREEIPPSSCLGCVVAERFIDVQTLCVIGMVGSALLGAWTWFGVVSVLWIGAWLVVVATVLNVDWLVDLPVLERFEEKFRALFDGFESLRTRPRYLAGVIGVSTSAWVTSLATLWVLGRMFGADLSAAAIAGLWPLAVFVGMIPVTVGGMGTRDGAFLGLLALAGVAVTNESALLTATFGYGVALVFLPALTGVPLLVRWLVSE